MASVFEVAGRMYEYSQAVEDEAGCFLALRQPFELSARWSRLDLGRLEPHPLSLVLLARALLP